MKAPSGITVEQVLKNRVEAKKLMGQVILGSNQESEKTELIKDGTKIYTVRKIGFYSQSKK